MILHSTKNSDEVHVLDHVWKRKYRVARETRPNGAGTDKVLKFHGMSAAWYFDGEEMHDPWLLQDLEFESIQHPDGTGELTPSGRPDLAIRGDGKGYTVAVADTEGKTRMQFEMEPWTPWLSEHRFARSDLWRHWGYDIMKIHAMRMRGTAHTPSGVVENLEGTAYFQKVRVNAPSVPWYWVVLHAENGMYIDYFQPNIGVQMWRRTTKQRSIVDRWAWGELKLRNNLEIYDPGSGTLHTIKKFRLRHTYDPGSEHPTFHVRGESATARCSMVLRCYSRAYWRFEQKHLAGLVKSILYYNEYPAELLEFEFEDKATGRKVTRSDLGFVAANCEQTWGKLY